MTDYEDIRPQAFHARRRAFDIIVDDLMRDCKRKSFTIRHGECGLVCRKSTFDDLPEFKFRTITMFVTRDGRSIAAARFRHWRMTGELFPGAESFIAAAESHSRDDHEMSEFVSAHWPDEVHPLEYGDIVVFDRLSVLTPSPDVWPLLTKGIERQFGKTMSLLVLKAFPFWEPESGGPRTVEFHRRQCGMKRRLRRLLDVTTVQGEDSDWMWRAFNGRVELAFMGGF
ncbi:hypothetical protein [Rhizobium sp. BK176]|uniref:hypothetical protein n=1 Tax=Rhizobium sp. BK176 TaxID=2587071 RepID=UPI002168B8C6|nr:hypothetical protein [Rhizobium sp. BK176]MCS4090128.1 hypothetical protein [Rhizobium sp. BK176]